MREAVCGILLGVLLLSGQSCATRTQAPPPTADEPYLVHQVHYQTGEQKVYRSAWVVAPDGEWARTPEVPAEQWCLLARDNAFPDEADVNINLMPGAGEPRQLAVELGLERQMLKGCM